MRARISSAALCESKARLFLFMAVELRATVTLDLSKYQAFKRDIEDQLEHRTEGPITASFRQWGAIYRSFVKERFDVYSKGGGDWPPLKLATKLARRGPAGKRKSKVSAREKARKIVKRVTKLKAKLGKTKTAKRYKEILGQIKRARAGLKKNTNLKDRKFSILRDTNTLFTALSPEFSGLPGQEETPISNGIQVGYGGNAKHPSAKTATVADIASYHQTGAGHLPVRRIIVEPTASVIESMTKVMQSAVSKIVIAG